MGSHFFHKHKKMTELKQYRFLHSPCNYDFVKNAENLKSNIEKTLIGTKH